MLLTCHPPAASPEDGSSASPGGRLYVSPRFRLYTADSDGDELLARLERHLDVTLDRLDQSWPEGAVVEYVRYRSRGDYQRDSGCPPATRGCYQAGRVRTPLRLHRHELVHAYAEALWGRTHRFVAEGLAVSLACHRPHARAARMSWRQAFAEFQRAKASSYVVAATLVTHLLARYGTARFAAFHQRVPPDASLHALDDALRAIYGVSADALWRDAQAAGSASCLAHAK